MCGVLPLTILYVNFVTFYQTLVVDHNDTGIAALSGSSELESVASEDRSGRRARTTFKIILSYHVGSFDGWQKQPGLNTVQRHVALLTNSTVLCIFQTTCLRKHR